MNGRIDIKDADNEWERENERIPFIARGDAPIKMFLGLHHYTLYGRYSENREY
jgi:hypothetical protein